MGISISVSKLKENLIASSETEDFPHPQNFLAGSTDGLKYLFEKVFLNVLIEKNSAQTILIMMLLIWRIFMTFMNSAEIIVTI